MELHDWIIDNRDLHFITKKQYERIRQSGVKAVGDFLSRGKKVFFMGLVKEEEHMVIGRSMHYTVYLCEWRGLLVAVKRLDIQHDNKNSASKLTRHLKDEIAILVKMHHPNIVQILGITLDPFQIVLEYFPLKDLSYFQTQRRSLLSCFTFTASSYKTKHRWSVDILLALIYLHERRPESVIHRDLKPSNVLVSDEGSLKITDFGISKIHSEYYDLLNSSDPNLDTLLESQSKKFDTFDIGTYWYMSPELRSRIPYDNKMDIWSLGLILYEIWEEKRVNTIASSPLDFIEKNSTRNEWIPFTFRTPRLMREMILKCLDVDPMNRPSVRKILSKTCSLPKRSMWF